MCTFPSFTLSSVHSSINPQTQGCKAWEAKGNTSDSVTAVYISKFSWKLLVWLFRTIRASLVQNVIYDYFFFILWGVMNGKQLILHVCTYSVTLLKMGNYSSITMCQYWDNHLIYWAVYWLFYWHVPMLCYSNEPFLTVYQHVILGQDVWVVRKAALKMCGPLWRVVVYPSFPARSRL